MNKICTSIEQSKKLIKLGIDVDTADCYWWKEGDKILIGTMFNGDYDSYTDTPAWSLEALMEYVRTLDHYKGKFIAIWSNEVGEHREVADNALEAVYKLVCWALENKVL